MKPFNLEEYLANPSRKVVARDGKAVKILCTNYDSSQPIIAEIEGRDYSQSFTKDGRYYIDNRNSPYDLFFAPTKHEGWINLFRDCYTGVNYPGCRLFNTKKEAKQNLAIEDDRYIATIKIEWEE